VGRAVQPIPAAKRAHGVTMPGVATQLLQQHHQPKRNPQNIQKLPIQTTTAQPISVHSYAVHVMSRGEGHERVTAETLILLYVANSMK
jgi:hypothetical protein